MSLWDSAAQSGACKVLYSEDMQDGQRFGSVRVLSPASPATRESYSVSISGYHIARDKYGGNERSQKLKYHNISVPPGGERWNENL